MRQANVRYIVEDVDAALEFYCGILGFEVQMHPAPQFAIIVKGDVCLALRRSVRFGRRCPRGRGRLQADPRWVEPNLVAGNRPLPGGGAIAGGRCSFPKRCGGRRRWPPGRARGSRRAIPLNSSRHTPTATGRTRVRVSFQLHGTGGGVSEIVAGNSSNSTGARTFTRTLVAALPRVDRRVHRMTAITGTVPNASPWCASSCATVRRRSPCGRGLRQGRGDVHPRPLAEPRPIQPIQPA